MSRSIVYGAAQEWMVRVMSDYIKREDAINIINYWLGDSIAQWLVKKIKNVPSADVAPFNHGHWIKHEGRNGAKDSIECSACGVWIDDMPRKTFCPNCGSIMYRYGDEDDD